jgi:hypothetical protein
MFCRNFLANFLVNCVGDTLLTDGNGKSSTVATVGENPSAKGRLLEKYGGTIKDNRAIDAGYKAGDPVDTVQVHIEH